MGKKKNIPVEIFSLQMFHRCTTNGYLLYTPQGAKKVLKPQFRSASDDKRDMAEKIKNAKNSGEDIHDEVSTQEIPRLAFSDCF